MQPRGSLPLHLTRMVFYICEIALVLAPGGPDLLGAYWNSKAQAQASGAEFGLPCWRRAPYFWGLEPQCNALPSCGPMRSSTLCGWTSLSRITSPMLEHSVHWSPRIKHCPAREMLVKPGSMKQRRCSKIQSKSGVYLHMNLPRLCTDYVAVLRTSSCFPQ